MSLQGGTVFHDLFKRDLEPFGVGLGMGFHVVGDVVETHVLIGGHLVGVDDGGVVGMAEPDMVELVFDEAESHGGHIYKGEDLVHLASHPHLLHEAAGGGLLHGLAVLGMTAAGVGPQAGGVVFRQGALLEQQFALRVKDEDGEGAVETRDDMGGHLLHDA